MPFKFPVWAKNFIADIGNGDPNIVDPGESKQNSGWAVEKPLLQHMNWIQNLFGQWITRNNTKVIVNNGDTLLIGSKSYVDNTAAIATVNLPEDPLDGQSLIVGTLGLVETYLVTVSGGTKGIMSELDTVINLDINNAVYSFSWSDSDNFWTIELQSILGSSL